MPIRESKAKVREDFTSLLEHFAAVLEALGEGERAAKLPWPDRAPDDDGPPSAILGARDVAAIALAFRLLNLVEENALAQERRRIEADLGAAAIPGSFAERFASLAARGVSRDELAATLGEVHVEPVLTAHPTEAQPEDALAHQRSLYLLLVRRENPIWTPAEREDLGREIRTVLELLWRTGEFLDKKPEITDERRSAVHYLRRVFPDALRRLDGRLERAWGETPPLPRVTFGTWVGGDRDGHPLVTARVTAATLAELRHGALDLHFSSLAELAAKLSLASRREAAPALLREAIARQKQLASKEEVARIEAAYGETPWRAFVWLIAARLPRDGAGGQPYASEGELTGDLAVLSAALDSVRASDIQRALVEPVRRLVASFGFHLATLDIRQNSATHDKALVELFDAGRTPRPDFPTMPEEERRRLLEGELATSRPFLPAGSSVGPIADEVLDTLRVLVRELALYGDRGLGSLIVSMTRGASDLLAVTVLAREAGLVVRTESGLACPLPIVPLFETADDLERAPSILDAFLESPTTKAGLALRSKGRPPLVDVMLGYSDSCKDAGIFASQWALARAERAIDLVVRKHGASARFFHGRGGTVSRGAGPTHRFLDALPRGTVSGALRVTEQGESIAQKYANLATATYQLELLTAGTVAACLAERAGPAAPNAEHAQLFERLAETSRKAYRALIDQPGFYEYFGEATPIDALEVARIGSRPARRSGRRTVEDLRAIPWVFAWNQSRHYLPGWYGLGTALSEIAVDEARSTLSEAARKDTFFRYVLQNVETAVASTALDVAASYASLARDRDGAERIFGLIREEHERVEAGLVLLLGGRIETRRPRMYETLRLRDRGLRALHAYQIDVLRRWREAQRSDEEDRDALLPELLLSLNAIAGGLRTTG